MKKLIIIVCMLSAALGAFVWYQGQSINPKDVLQINIYNGDASTPEHSYYNEDQEKLGQIIDIFDSKTPINEDVDFTQNTPKYTLDIITDKGEHSTYELHISLEKEKIQIYDLLLESYYTVADITFRNLVSMEGFYSLYESSAPKVALTYSTITIPTKITDSTWAYTLADGTPMEKTSLVTLDMSNNKLPLNPEHRIELFSERQPGILTLKVYEGQLLIHQEEIDDNGLEPIKHDGVLRYDIVSQWNKTSDSAPYGRSVSSFYGEMDLKPELVMDKSIATAGDVIVVEILNVNEDQTPEVTQTLSKDFKLRKAGDRYFGFIAMNYWVKPGNYTVTLKVSGKDSTAITSKYPVTIQSKEFNKQYLTIDKNVASSTRNDAAYEEYAKYFTPMRDASIDEKLWDGTFIQPVEGRISTEFGEMRYVNGSLTSYRHSGIDIAAPTGTEIVAPNSGYVKLSRSLILTGETIVIDHGYGIFSIYFHMDSRSVMAGDSVEKGQLIGTVGTTGFSTGPHLHWTMSHYKTNLSPWLFMDRELITFE